MNWFRKKNRESGDRDIRKPDIGRSEDQGQKPCFPNSPISSSLNTQIPKSPVSGSPDPRISFSYVIPVLLALFTGFLMIHTAAVVSSPQNFTSGPPYGQTDWTVENSSATSTLPINPATYVTYTLKTSGILAGTDIRLESSGYTATDDGTLSTTGVATGGTFALAAKVNTFLNPSAADTTASVKLLYVWQCGDPITVNHATAGGVAPVTKTVTYGTVSTTLGGTGSKCWITQNLGAVTNAASAVEGTEPNAGWYWQFNRKQGYKHDGTTRTPSSAWITSINESSNWSSANDPCTIELGAGWRLPTSTEWTNADSTGGWANYNNTYGSVLKLHAAGYLHYSSGALFSRGTNGNYWSSTQLSSTNGYNLYFTSSLSYMITNNKADGFSVRCLKD